MAAGAGIMAVCRARLSGRGAGDSDVGAADQAGSDPAGAAWALGLPVTWSNGVAAARRRDVTVTSHSAKFKLLGPET